MSISENRCNEESSAEAKKSRQPSPAAAARIAAGLTPKEAAKRAHICLPYLRRIERRGGAPYVLAIRLAHVCRCSANVFLQPVAPLEGGRDALARRRRETALRRRQSKKQSSKLEAGK